MAQKNISMPLSIVPPSQERANGTQKPILRYRLSGYELIRLLQKFGVMLLILVLSVAAYQGICHFFVRSVKVVGVSMVPTLQEGGSYLLDVWSFSQREPQRN